MDLEILFWLALGGFIGPRAQRLGVKMAERVIDRLWRRRALVVDYSRRPFSVAVMEAARVMKTRTHCRMQYVERDKVVEKLTLEVV